VKRSNDLEKTIMLGMGRGGGEAEQEIAADPGSSGWMRW